MPDRRGEQLGNYRLVRLLGEGGFAQVYLGEHVFLKKQAAIKVLHGQVTDDVLATVLGEAQTIARLEHPHIVRVLDFGVENKIPFLIMSHAPNGTLRQRHCEGSCLPLDTMVSYLTQIAPALQYAHSRKVIHRDIKPQNMLIGLNDELLLSDFGIAVVFESTSFQSTQNQAGTAAYMAPEQYQGKPRPASDQYALGVVVYEWLCGERPFQGTHLEMAMQHQFAAPPPLREQAPHISPKLEHVVLKALAKDPKERFASVQDFAHAFEQACQSPSPALSKTPLAPSSHEDVSSQPPPAPRSPTFMPQQPTTHAVSTPQQSVVLPPSAPTSHHFPLSPITTPVSTMPLSSSASAAPQARDAEMVVSRTPLAQRRKRVGGRVFFTLGLLLLVALSGSGLIYFGQRSPTLAPTQATATAVMATVAAQTDAAATARQGVMFGFDAAHTHDNPFEHTIGPGNVSQLTPLWSFATGSDISSSPAVAGGLVYVGSDDDKLYAFHLRGTTH